MEVLARKDKDQEASVAAYVMNKVSFDQLGASILQAIHNQTSGDDVFMKAKLL